jgi:hypothetical protein
MISKDGLFHQYFSDGTTLYDVPREPSLYTYVVKDNATFAAWVNGVAGNDYTSVLILPGTYTIDTTLSGTTSILNLSAVGTKRVTGMQGNNLVFNNTSTGATTLSAIRGYVTGAYPIFEGTDAEYSLTGVNITVNNTKTAAVETTYIFGFGYCANMKDCSVAIDGTGGSNTWYYGTYGCVNIVACSADAVSPLDASGFRDSYYIINSTGKATGARGNTSGKSYGFYNCRNIIGSFGIADSSGVSGSGETIGFTQCRDMAGCTGYGKGMQWTYGIGSCYALSGCYGYANPVGTVSGGYGISSSYYMAGCEGYAISTDREVAGIYGCSSLSACYGSAESTSGNAYGIAQANRLTSCKANSIATSGTKYDFYGCKGMVLNVGTTSARAFNSCYVGNTSSGDTPANTAAGGWNNPY